ncbi:V-type ATP synthase subunit F [Peptoniphilus catoniae]|uniref:V-type ATP synthase subunit F n=1 Tax=Peptoniphilus catoniae TaxID=1660341 RepID=UPI0010FE4CAF|nr:V-type ATP synthase subunit F [Peptoniphilus catoniae]
MYRIAVVGDKDSILAFKALGIDVYIAYEGHEARKIVDELAGKNYGVIFITEELASKIPETVERYDSRVLPAIILIPSNKGSMNIGMENISSYVEKAIGSDIL